MHPVLRARPPILFIYFFPLLASLLAVPSFPPSPRSPPPPPRLSSMSLSLNVAAEGNIPASNVRERVECDLVLLTRPRILTILLHIFHIFMCIILLDFTLFTKRQTHSFHVCVSYITFGLNCHYVMVIKTMKRRLLAVGIFPSSSSAAVKTRDALERGSDFPTRVSRTTKIKGKTDPSAEFKWWISVGGKRNRRRMLPAQEQPEVARNCALFPRRLDVQSDSRFDSD